MLKRPMPPSLCSLASSKTSDPQEIGTMDAYLASEPKSLSSLEDMVLKWDSLVQLNSDREADSILRVSRVQDLDECLAETKTFVDSLEDTMRTDIQELLSKTETWFGENKEDMSISKEFEAKSIRLRSVKRYIEKKLAKAADDARRLEEAEKAASKDGTEAPDGKPPMDTLEEKPIKPEENMLSSEKIKEMLEKSMDDLASENSKESEAISKTLNEMSQREVL